MSTRLRDKASNTDTSIILDSGTSYAKRDDQTVPVYRGVTSSNITGVGGWTWLDRAQRDAAGAWYGTGGYWAEANVADWGIPVGATAVKFNYRWSGSAGTQMSLDWYGNDTQGTGNTAPLNQNAEGFHDRWLQFRDEVNLAGQIIGWPSATGRCLYRRSDSSGTLDMYPIGYQMTAGTSATQANLDAALTRITELENNAGGGGQMINVISGSETAFYTDYQIPNWQAGDKLFWYNTANTEWKELVAGSGEQLVGHNLVQVSTTGLLKSRNVGDNTQGRITFFHMRGGVNLVSR